MDRLENCTLFGTCGGCSLLNVPYSEQLQLKDSEIQETFSELIEQGVLPRSAIQLILGAKDPYRYRDKVTSPFVPARKAYRLKTGTTSSEAIVPPHTRSKGKRVDVITGIYAKGTHKVVPMDNCLLENPVASKTVAAIKFIMLKHGIEPYDEDTGKGFMRHAIVRVGHKSDEVLITLVTNSDEFPHSKSFCKELVSKVPECTSIVQNVNTRQTNVILGEKFRRLYGPGFILDELCGMSFRISPGAFYQVNSTQTEVLYEKAVELAGIEPGVSIIDAYCGTGTIGLVAAKTHNNPLLGLDSSKEAIADARANAKHNGIGNAAFIAEDATEFMKGLANGYGVADLTDGFDLENLMVFLDPPRSGATEEFLDALISLEPKRVIYISCNPKTQARDCEILCKACYKLEILQPVDMFPHTPHIESIALLNKE